MPAKVSLNRLSLVSMLKSQSVDVDDISAILFLNVIVFLRPESKVKHALYIPVSTFSGFKATDRILKKH